MARKGKIYIGTSGWHYKHWEGTFYPADIKENEMFTYYQKLFDTVEINNSFYRLPLAATFTHWKDEAAGNFIFAVKASRFITHMKKLNFDKTGISKFFNRIKKLQDKSGPVLFQLPPKWHVNTERLESFLSILPQDYRYTFEFRDNTWHTEGVFEVLKKYNASFCIYELAGYRSPMEVTADFIYIRLHGPGDKYQGNYTITVLEKWAAQINNWRKQNLDVYCYFDNDQAGYAAFNAAALKSMIK